MSTKVRLVKAMVFPVVMYGCESWTIKEAERRRIDVFELWCWRRLLRVPWTARRSNQSILKEISPGCSLEGLVLRLKLQYFGHLMRRADSFEETLMLGKIEGRKTRGRQRMRWLDDSVDMSMRNSRSWWWTGRPGVLWFMGSQRVGHNWSTELNWVLLKLWRPSIPSYIHLNRSLNKTQESHWASSVCHSVTWRFLCLWVQVVSLWHLDSELLIHTVNAAIVLSGFLSILIFTVSHITLWSKHYIIFKAKAFLSIFR